MQTRATFLGRTLRYDKNAMASHDLDSTQKRFAHLHQHTQYSLLDGAAKIKDLLKWVKHVSPDEPACAITDHGNMYGAVAFYNYATAMEVKPIVGYEAYVTSGSRKDRKRGEDNEKSIFHLTLLAQNFEGYQNLCRLSSLAYLEGYYYKPRIDHELIETYHKGIIAFSGCLGAEVPQLILKDQLTEARARLEWYLKIFKDNYFIEIQNHGLKEQQQVNEILRAWARELGVGMVATNDGHYVTKDDARAHETLLAIQTKVTLADENRFRFPCDEFYVKDLKEMQEALPQDVWGDEPFDNTMNIARMCNLELPVGRRRVYQMPQLPIPEGRTMSEELRLQTYQGLLKRYSCLTLDWIRDYVKRSFSVLSDLPRYFSPGSSSADAQDPTTLNLQCLGLDLDFDAMGTDDLLFWLAKLGSDMEVLGKNAGYKYTQYPALDELERESSDLALEVMRRAEYELAVINTMGFPDYFLIVADYINWAKEHGIAVGPGRGCLSGEVPIVMGDGTTRSISEIRAGDRVRSHTGRALPVTAVHRYAIDETLVRLHCHCGDGVGVTLTADHKVFAQKNTHLNTTQSFSKASIENLSWLPAGELRPGDWVFVPRPEIEENAEMTRVFEAFCECVGPTKVAAFGRGGTAQMAVERTSVAQQVLPKCEAFYRFLGRWMANGWMSDPGGLGVSFGPDDHRGIEETAAFLRALGLEPQLQSENENSARLTVQNRSLWAYWQTLFPNGEKTVPEFVFHLSEEDILEVLSGYGLRSGVFTTVATSRTLADQVRFLLWRCSIPASLRQEEGRFILTIAQQGLPSLGEPETGTEVWKKVSGGILLQLLDVTQVSGVKEVFDLTVAEDHTYQTSSFAVHNSGAGSIVAYAVRITNLDPLTFGLLFERFLNPDRVSMPDFDIDFSDSRREEVIQYVREKYGDDRVAQIATFGSLSSRAVLKDVARVMGIPHKDADQVSKLIPVKFGKAYTLEQAKQAVPDIQQALDQHPTLAEAYQSAQKLEGLTRHASVHAAGVVIGKTDLTDLVPLMRDPSGGMNVCQYDMKAVEDIGLIKMDFLGLRTLSFLEEAARIVKESKGVDLDFDAIPFDDEATFDLLSRGDNKGVFQLEGTGIADASRRLKPRRLADIIALSALYRPGPMENIPTYIRRHHGTEAVSYEDYPNSEVWLSAILKETYGIPVYQEQIMQIASQVAGYTLGQADLLRRAMGKKDAKEMQQQRILFVEGSQKNGVPEEEASRLFDLLEAFANYGFNKCLIGSTEIVASDGKRHTLREMFERQEMPMLPSIQGDLTFTLNPVGAVFKNGIKSVYEVRTSLGKSIFATQNHPFLTPDGWKNLEDLSAGDEIASPAILPIKGRKTWPKHRLVLLAWILSEKISVHSSKISVSKYDQGILKDILETISQFKNTFPRVFEHKGNGGYEICIENQKNLGEKSEIELFLEEYDAHAQKDCEKYFPVEIFELNNYDLALLIGRYWNDLDGLYETENSIFYVEVPSKRMASDLQHLLLRFRVVSRIKENQPESPKDKAYFSVEILEKSKAQFLEMIGVHCLAKAHHLKELGQYRIPALSNSAYRFEAKTSHQPTSPSEFSQDFTGDVYWETIESVVPAGEQMTYDLEVADTHNFVANDLIVHNSHSAAYGVISYQTAWLKANHPVEFIAALLTVEHQDSDKVAEYINDAKKMEVVVLPPDIHRSGADFRVVGEKIYFGLLAIKNLGENAVFKILEEREHRGPFRSLADFCCRVDKRLVNSRALEHLIQAGAFDLFGERSQLLASLEEAMEYAAKKHVMAGNGMDSLFGMAEMAPEPKLKEGVPQSTLEKLKFEKEALGLYISGHPLEQYEGVREAASCPISNLESWFGSQPKGQGRTKAVLSGMVSGIQKKPTKSGGMMARFLLADETGSIELVAFGKGYERIQEKLQEDIPALVICEIDAQEGSLRSIAEALVRIEDLEGIPQIAYMTLDASSHAMDSYIDLKSVLDEDSGTYRLVLRMEYENMYEVWDVRSTFVSRDGLERVVKMFPWVKASLAYDATSILARFAPKPRWTGPKKPTGSA